MSMVLSCIVRSRWWQKATPKFPVLTSKRLLHPSHDLSPCEPYCTLVQQTIGTSITLMSRQHFSMETSTKKYIWNSLKGPKNPAKKTGCADSTRAFMGCVRPAANGQKSYMTASLKKGLCVVQLSTVFTPGLMELELPSVGEVRSGPVPGHFCQTGDQTVRSLMKYLGPGPGTATNRLYRSGPGPDRVQTVPALFIYLFIQD